MKVVGRRLPPGNPFASGEWDGFLELAETFRLKKGFVPRGVYRFRSYQEELEWEDRMLLGEVAGAGYRRNKGRKGRTLPA
ncbi:MAG: hypothetical protein H5U00_12460 [Clostridia bacterium]|nr:hypothetical protein [Clostridia bacterium]